MGPGSGFCAERLDERGDRRLETIDGTMQIQRFFETSPHPAGQDETTVDAVVALEIFARVERRIAHRCEGAVRGYAPGCRRIGSVDVAGFRATIVRHTPGAGRITFLAVQRDNLAVLRQTEVDVLPSTHGAHGLLQLAHRHAPCI